MLFDLPNRRVPTGDLDIVTSHSAKYRASERRDIGYGTPCGFGFIFTNDAEGLRPAIVPPHGHCGPKMYFAYIGRRFDDLRGRSSCIPVSKLALSCCDPRPIVLSYRSFVCCLKTA